MTGARAEMRTAVEAVAIVTACPREPGVELVSGEWETGEATKVRIHGAVTVLVASETLVPAGIQDGLAHQRIHPRLVVAALSDRAVRGTPVRGRQRRAVLGVRIAGLEALGRRPAVERVAEQALRALRRRRPRVGDWPAQAVSRVGIARLVRALAIRLNRRAAGWFTAIPHRTPVASGVDRTGINAEADGPGAASTVAPPIGGVADRSLLARHAGAVVAGIWQLAAGIASIGRACVARVAPTRITRVTRIAGITGCSDAPGAIANFASAADSAGALAVPIARVARFKLETGHAGALGTRARRERGSEQHHQYRLSRRDRQAHQLAADGANLPVPRAGT